MKIIAIVLGLIVSSAVVAGSPQKMNPAEAFVQKFGQPNDKLVADRKWARASQLDLAAFEVTPLMTGTEQVEENHYSLLVHRKTGQVYLARQGGFKGDWQFFGPITLNGT